MIDTAVTGLIAAELSCRGAASVSILADTRVAVRPAIDR